MDVTTFETAVSELLRRYDLVSLDDVIGPARTAGRRPRVVLCFDDAYASVARLAAPVLARLGVPWTFFINAALLDNRRLATDNLVAYATNTQGPQVLSRVAGQPVSGANDLLRRVLPTMSLEQRRRLESDLAAEVGVVPAELAAERRLYLTRAQVRRLAADGVEIGNHTFEHVHCRVLNRASAAEQIAGNAELLRELTGGQVRAFAYPYGSRQDATPLATRTLQESGHTCAFLVGGRRNTSAVDPFHLYRISTVGSDAATQALDLQVLPRLRRAKALLRRESDLC
jgi:peptidoglycan/xylan/chitin deacetylase (PgdA/CDA1 family)